MQNRTTSSDNTQSAQTAPPPLLRFGPGSRPGPGMGGKVEKAKNVRGTVRRLWGYLRRQRLSLIATALMVVASAGLDLLGPLLLGRAIDQYIIPRNLPGLLGLLALMALVYAASAALNYLQSYVMAGAAQATIRNLRTDLFTKLQHLPLQFFDQRPHGEMMSRLTNDVESVNQVLSNSVTQITSGILSTVGVTIAMIVLSPILAIVTIVSAVSMTIVINRWIAKRTRAAFREQQGLLGKLNGLVEETVTGQKVVKAYAQEDKTIAQFDAVNQDLRAAATTAQTFAGFVGPMMNVIGNSQLAVVAGVGGYLAVRGLSSVGNIATFISYSRQFGRPLSDIANLFNAIQSAIAGAERVFAVIDEQPEVDAPHAQAAQTIGGEVVFEDVTFAYREGTPVLKNIHLQAHPGQTIALIGPTGAGKTTIINLLTRFYEIERGRITIDGQDIRDIAKDDLRQQLGIVLQDTFLFAGTVKDNLRYGRLDATDEEIAAAARLANADIFIDRLPQGYDTVLSERASNLSHGQRQLLAIGRAILANPRILILDEATSSVDTRTEKHIQEALLRLMRGRTSFVIAHRLSTIREADQILVINNGEIIERGTHHSLLAERGFYYRLSARSTLGLQAV